MSIATSTEFLRITATTVDLVVRCIAVSRRVQRVIADEALEAATMVHLKEEGDGDELKSTYSINLSNVPSPWPTSSPPCKRGRRTVDIPRLREL